MRRLSERTGGAYARATNREQLEEIYNTIASLEKSRFERERLTRYDELAGYALLPGMALLLLQTVLTTTWLRRAP
jgi:Ca-activated chloride channel family protein